MSASEGWRLGTALLCGVAMVFGLAPASAQQNSREQEQLRRLRQQIQQLQQQHSDQQQAVQRTEADKTQALTQLEAAQTELKRTRATLAARVRLEGQAQNELQDLREQNTRLGAELEATKAEAQAGARSLQQQRNDQAALQRRLEQRDAALADLQARHGSQAQGLQTCIANNHGLYSLGQELLKRYVDKGLGEVFAQNEPFLQFKRVTLENLVQGYQERLDQQALKAAPAREVGRAP